MDKALQQYLETFLSVSRIERFKQVIAQRTKHATVVLEDIYQSQNASAVMRTCECLGVQDFYVIEQKHKYNVNKQVVRGANKWTNVHKFSKHEDNTKACLESLKIKGYQIAVTLPGEDAVPITELDVERPTAFVFGTEKFGASETAIAMSDVKVTIPMYGFTESYNVSVSVAICLFHFLNETKKKNVRWTLPEQEQEELLHEWTKRAIKKSDLIVQEFFTKHRGKIDSHI